MFTDRFIKVPIRVYDLEQSELIGKLDLTETFMDINPLEISHYRPAEDENGELNYLSIDMRSGDDFQVRMSVNEFETLLNNWSDKR